LIDVIKLQYCDRECDTYSYAQGLTHTM